jgi:hypothetical protein
MALNNDSIRTFDELRRDIEQGLKTLSVTVNRVKQSGYDSDAQWAMKRVKTSLEQAKKAPGKDSIVVNRLIAEVAHREREIRNAEHVWLLAQSNAAKNAAVSDQRRQETDEEQRARLYRGNDILDQSDNLIADSERMLNQATQSGTVTLDTMYSQGEDMAAIRNNVSETTMSAKSAGLVLRQMLEYAFYNRVFLWTIIAFLFIADVSFLYFAFIKK